MRDVVEDEAAARAALTARHELDVTMLRTESARAMASLSSSIEAERVEMKTRLAHAQRDANVMSNMQANEMEAIAQSQARAMANLQSSNDMLAERSANVTNLLEMRRSELEETLHAHRDLSTRFEALVRACREVETCFVIIHRGSTFTLTRF